MNVSLWVIIGISELKHLQWTKRQSVAGTGYIRLADYVYPCFETMSTFQQRWVIKFCTKLGKKLPKLTNCLEKPTESLLYRMCMLQGVQKSLKRDRKRWTMTSVLEGHQQAKSIKMWLVCVISWILIVK